MQRSAWVRRAALGVAAGLSLTPPARADELLPPPPPPGRAATLPAVIPPPPPLPPPAECKDPLVGPLTTEGKPPTALADPPIDRLSRGLPINLAAALRLADARPLVIQFAQARVEEAAGVLTQAEVLWLPSVYFGFDYQRHDGGAQQIPTGNIAINGRQQIVVGGGYSAVFATTDAIFAPLAARQVLRSRQADVQSARNDALRDTAEAYFNVQEARGRYAGALDTVAKARDFLKRVQTLAKDLVPPVEIDRARTTLADLEQTAAIQYAQWQSTSADLTRVLRLDPGAVVAPAEPPYLQVTLVPPATPVDALIPIGLMNRPELESQRALVQATLERLKQERLRPLIPSVVLQGNAAPPGPLAGGYFATGRGLNMNQTSLRHDIDFGLTWELRNLLAGNRGLIQERAGQNRAALVELYRTQDGIAAEVVQAHAQLDAAAVRVREAERGLKAALLSFEGNLKGLSETIRFGDILQLVNRPQEVVSAIQQLDQGYRNYFLTANDYNRAQFRLFRALGYPARTLACERTPGVPVPVNTDRPPYLPPVAAPEPCADCAKP